VKRITPDKKKEIIAKYNSTSHFYDKRYTEIQYGKYDIILDKYKEVKGQILDAGAGTGLFLDYILEITDYNKFSYVGLDISANMLLTLKDKMKSKYKMSMKKINIILADIENLPFRNNSFDLMLALTSIQNLPDPIKGVIELYNASKEGAIYHFSILRKKFYKKALVSELESRSKKIDFIDKKDLEDVIFQGIFTK